MMRYNVIFLFTLLTLLDFSQSDEANWCKQDLNLYEVYDFKLDWDDAREMCKANGGDLISAGLRGKAIRSLIFLQLIPHLPIVNQYWIGITAVSRFFLYYVDDVFVTEANSDFHSQPSLISTHCATIVEQRDEGFLMIGDSCSEVKQFICEFPCRETTSRELMCNKYYHHVGSNNFYPDGKQVTVTFLERFCEYPKLKLRAFGNTRKSNTFEATVTHTSLCNFYATVKRVTNESDLRTTWQDQNVLLEWQVDFAHTYNTVNPGDCNLGDSQCTSCPWNLPVVQDSCFDGRQCEAHKHHCNGSQVWNGKSCSCEESGYIKIDTGCQDADECSFKPSVCAGKHTCVNLPGSFVCDCDPGFVGSSCEDVDECLIAGEFPCHSNATCTNTHGSFECTCKLGFQGNGFFCEDLCGNTVSLEWSQLSGPGNSAKITFPQRFCQMPSLQLKAYSSSPGDLQTTLWHTDFCGFRVNVSNGAGQLLDNPNVWLEWNATFANQTEPAITESCDPARGKCELCSLDKSSCYDGRNCMHIHDCDGVRLWDGTNCVCPLGYLECSGTSECIAATCHKEAYCVISKGQYSCICRSGFTGNGDECAETNCTACFTKVGLKCKLNLEYVSQIQDSDNCVHSIISNGDLSSSFKTATLVSEFASVISNLTNSRTATKNVVKALAAIANNTKHEKIELLPKTVGDLLHLVENLAEVKWSRKKALRTAIGVYLRKVKITERSRTFSYHSPLIDARVEDITENSDRHHFVFSPSTEATPKIGVPRSALRQGKSRVKGTSNDVMQESTRLVFTYHKHANLFATEQTVSSVIGASVGETTFVANPPVVIQFGEEDRKLVKAQSHPEANSFMKEKRRFSCAYYDNTKFVKEGCCLVPDSQQPKCECDRLAYYAILFETELVLVEVALGTVSTVGCCLSIVGAALTIAALTINRGGKLERAEKNLIVICVNLMISNLIFVVGIARTEPRWACTLVSALLHYFMLVTWCWVAVQTYEVYYTISKAFKDDNADGNGVDIFMKRAVPCAYLAPAFVVVTSFMVAVFYLDPKQPSPYCGNVADPLAPSSYRAENMCWITGYPLSLGLQLPIVALIIFNVGVFLAVFREIWCKNFEQRHTPIRKSHKQSLYIAAYISTIVGLPWAFGYSQLTTRDANYSTSMSWVFALLNTLQGFSIWMLTIARSPERRKLWWHPIRRVLFPGDSPPPKTEEVADTSLDCPHDSKPKGEDQGKSLSEKHTIVSKVDELSGTSTDDQQLNEHL